MRNITQMIKLLQLQHRPIFFEQAYCYPNTQLCHSFSWSNLGSHGPIFPPVLWTSSLNYQCLHSWSSWEPSIWKEKYVLSSQNHRAAGVGGDLWRSSGPTTLLNQGHLGPVAQDHIQMASEYLQGWRLHNLHGEPVPVLHHPHSQKVFAGVQRDPPVFQFCPLSLVRSRGTTEKSLAPSSLHPPLRYLCTLVRFPHEPSLL